MAAGLVLFSSNATALAAAVAPAIAAAVAAAIPKIESAGANTWRSFVEGRKEKRGVPLHGRCESLEIQNPEVTEPGVSGKGLFVRLIKRVKEGWRTIASTTFKIDLADGCKLREDPITLPAGETHVQVRWETRCQREGFAPLDTPHTFSVNCHLRNGAYSLQVER